jgi:hypothetical protein
VSTKSREVHSISKNIEYHSVALGLAISVHSGRVSYPFAEITLMQLRAGRHYERIDEAFDEAAAALQHFLRLVDEIDSLCRPCNSMNNPHKILSLDL